MTLDYLSTYTKVNYKWIKDLNVITQTLKLLEKKYFKTGIGKNFQQDFNCSTIATMINKISKT